MSVSAFVVFSLGSSICTEYDDYVLMPSQSAHGWDHQEPLSKHESQTDAAKGFGGKYGVQKEGQDKVRVY